jgi:hypothetical protein
MIKSRRVRRARLVTRMGKRRGVYRNWWGNLRERGHLEDPVIDGGDNIKMDFQEWCVGAWNGSRWFRMGTGGGHL